MQVGAQSSMILWTYPPFIYRKLKEELSQRAEENTVLNEEVGSGLRTITAQSEEIKSLKENNKLLVERLKQKSRNTDQLVSKGVKTQHLKKKVSRFYGSMRLIFGRNYTLVFLTA